MRRGGERTLVLGDEGQVVVGVRVDVLGRLLAQGLRGVLASATVMGELVDDRGEEAVAVGADLMEDKRREKTGGMI